VAINTPCFLAEESFGADTKDRDWGGKNWSVSKKKELIEVRCTW